MSMRREGRGSRGEEGTDRDESERQTGKLCETEQSPGRGTRAYNTGRGKPPALNLGLLRSGRRLAGLAPHAGERSGSS